MGDRNEENGPPIPNKSEKTRFGLAPNLLSDGEPRPHESPGQTRFNMAAPTFTQVPRTAQFRFETSPEVDSGVDEPGYETFERESILSHASGKEKLKFGQMFYLFFVRGLQVFSVLFLLAVLFGLMGYFLFYDSIYQGKTGSLKQPAGAELSIPPTNVRFFDLLVAGRRFAYLIDATETMGPFVDSPKFLYAENRVQQSLKELQEFDFYEVFFFNSKLIPTHGSETRPSLVAVTPAHLHATSEMIGNVEPAGTCDLKNIILTTLEAKPDIILLACTSSVAEQLGTTARETLKTAAGETKIYAVEIGDSSKPLNMTPLEKLVQEVGGQYQWYHFDDSSDLIGELHAAKRNVFENVSIPPLTEMIEGDFKFYDDVSREDTRKISPFGKEIVANLDRSGSTDQLLTDSPKVVRLSNQSIREIETDARIVYLSGFAGMPQSPNHPAMLRVGAENRLALWIQGAKAELPAAEYLIGLCYKNGVRVKQDENKAFQCELRAAQQGCQPAMYLVAAEYHEQGESGSTADKNALYYSKYWAEKGAKLGEPLSQCFWANHFAAGAEDRFAWLEKSAKQNLPEAQYLLGKCYETGNGTAQDMDKAGLWYERSSKQGFAAAQMALDKIQRNKDIGNEGKIEQ